MLTGGGAELKHIKQLVEYKTGIDTRIGYPNEHLAGDSEKEISSPLFATAVGLVMESDRNRTRGAVSLSALKEETKLQEIKQPIEIKRENPFDFSDSQVLDSSSRVTYEDDQLRKSEEEKEEHLSTADRFETGFLGKFYKKIKEFIEKSE